MGSTVRRVALAAVWLFGAWIGASWCWAAISIATGNVAGTCEKTQVEVFGTGIGPTAGTCLARSEHSSWGLPGMLAAVLVLLVGVVILAALLSLLGGELSRRLARRA